MRFVSTDSCPKIKGKYAGFMAELEKLMGRALFRIFCIKHTIEVHWHRFVKLRDGLTQGPKTFNGKTCRMLEKEDFWKSDIVDFTPIAPNPNVPSIQGISDADLKALNNDVQHLLRYYKLVTTGVCVVKPYDSVLNPSGGDLALRFANPGALHNARWVTLANRVLRLYVSQVEPDEVLVALVTYVVRIYVPSWIDVIVNGSALDAPKVFQRMLSNYDSLVKEGFFRTELEYDHPDDSKKKKDKRRLVSELFLMERCINQNAFFAHCEPVLVAMLCDAESLANREKAYETIVLIRKADELRSEARGRKEIRVFEPPEVNWAVDDYTQFVSFDNPSALTEPPLR